MPSGLTVNLKELSPPLSQPCTPSPLHHMLELPGTRRQNTSQTDDCTEEDELQDGVSYIFSSFETISSAFIKDEQQTDVRKHKAAHKGKERENKLKKGESLSFFL